MKRAAQPSLTVEGQQALDQYTHALQQMEDLTVVTIRNYLSDLRQFMPWCECYRREEQDERPFTTQAIAPRHLNDEEESALVAAVNATGTLRDRTIITLLLHTGLRARELCTLMHKQVQLGKRSGMLRIVGKRNKVRDVPLKATARFILGTYLKMHPGESSYLFPSEKTQEALTERALRHLITKYARQAHLIDVSPHDLRHCSGYRIAEVVPLHRLAQITGYDSLDTTMLYIRGTKQDLQHGVEKIAWI